VPVVVLAWKRRSSRKRNSRHHRHDPSPMPPSGGSPFDPYAWWPNDPSMWSFQRIEVYKDKVQCSTPYALAGTLMCSYTAEVVTSGAHFVLPPAHAYSITDPGTMGLSAAANFSVDRL